MKKAYPKDPEKIDIFVLIHSDNPGEAVGDKEKTKTTLHDLLEKWLLHMGYSSAYIKGVVCQLLTSGKIQVVFRDRTERFELADYSDVLTSTQAMKLLEDYANNRKGYESSMVPSRSLSTQRIVFQPPRY